MRKESKPYIAEIVPNLIKLRHEKGMTQKTLAERTGYSLSVIQKLESYHGKASLRLIETVANALGYDLIVYLRLKEKAAPLIPSK